MARFVSIIIAILRTKFVSITTVIIETLYKNIFIETTIIIIIIKKKKNNQNKSMAREEGESRERDLPGHEKGRAVSVQFPGFNALFYTICQRVTRGRHSLQYDQLWTKIDLFPK